MASSRDPEELARRARLEQAVESRSRRALWDRLGEDEATLARTLERSGTDGRSVRIGTGSGEHSGRVVEVGPDHVALEGPTGYRYVRLSGVETVVVNSTEAREPSGSALVVNRTFDDLLARLAGTGEPITLVLRSGEGRRGTIEARGVDVLTLRQEEPTVTIYVSSSAVVEVRAGVGSG